MPIAAMNLVGSLALIDNTCPLPSLVKLNGESVMQWLKLVPLLYYGHKN
jgi:hypothetical protein